MPPLRQSVLLAVPMVVDELRDANRLFRILQRWFQVVWSQLRPPLHHQQPAVGVRAGEYFADSSVSQIDTVEEGGEFFGESNAQRICLKETSAAPGEGSRRSIVDSRYCDIIARRSTIFSDLSWSVFDCDS